MKALIFDMDGTILDTLKDIEVSVNVALRHFNYPVKTLDEVRKNVGKGAQYLMKKMLPEDATKEHVKAVFDIYQAYYDAHATDHTGPYPHIIETLNILKSRGYKLAVVSNKFEYLVQKLNKEVFYGLFDVCVGEVEGIPIKPAPDMIFKALNLLDVKKDESIYIGDSETDMLTAKNAALKVIAVTWGFRTQQELEPYNPDFMIDQPQALLDVIERITR